MLASLTTAVIALFALTLASSTTSTPSPTLTINYQEEMPSRPGGNPTSVADAELSIASSYPYGEAVANEFKWRNWDPNDPDQKIRATKIHEAFIEWQELVKAGLEAASKTNSTSFMRWFKTENQTEEVRLIFNNAWNTTAETASDIVATMVCDFLDFKKSCKMNARAWTVPETGVFHICDSGLSSPLNAELKCELLGLTCSARMRSLPLTLMREIARYEKIRVNEDGMPIITDAYYGLGTGAWDSFNLNPYHQLGNAQNYAWLAGEAYWSKNCSRNFSDPDPSIDYTGRDEVTPGLNPALTGPLCTGGGVQFHQKEADLAIVYACDILAQKPFVLVPPVSLGDHVDSTGRNKFSNIRFTEYIDGKVNKIWVGISFAENNCMGKFRIDPSKCKENLRRILNGCDTSGLFPKYGGVIQDGCAVYHLSAAPTSSSDPIYFLGEHPDTLGKFTCIDTNVTRFLGTDSPLAGTCTCWYTRMDTVTDIFNKPAGGCSALNGTANPRTN